MKINLNLLLAIIFIALSIWLSFSVKQTNEKLFQSEAQVKDLERDLGIGKYQLEIMQEALALNIGKAPMPTRLTSRLTSFQAFPGSGNDGIMALLYLKAHACSPCNMPVIEGLIKTGADSGHFQVASHSSNRHFLQPVIQKNGLADTERIQWLSDKLYDYHQPVYDAELLFIDPGGFILGVLPLELLKERTLFESWLVAISNPNSSDDSKSSDE